MFKIKNFVLGIGIVVVFALTLWQGIEAFYPSPAYEDFCKGTDFGRYPVKENLAAPISEQTCTFSKNLQEQQQRCYNEGGTPIFEYNDSGCTINIKNCDFCNKEFNEATDSHAKTVFYISLIISILVLIIGFSVLSIEPVGSALLGSAIWSIFYGTVINWRNFSNIWRFLLLFFVLILIIWITLRLNSVKEKKKGFWISLGFGKSQ
ncbi:MAG: hypothetical protein AABX73_01480 [Nanoarchaeota archaeon]